MRLNIKPVTGHDVKLFNEKEVSNLVILQVGRIYVDVDMLENLG